MIKMTKLFETIHPMTYFFTMQSVMWAFMIILHVFFDGMNILRVGDMFWPEPLTYVWATALVISGIILLVFFLRDFEDRRRERIWATARVNMSLWAWAMVFWIAVSGSQVILIISILNFLGFSYIGLACKQTRVGRRI